MQVELQTWYARNFSLKSVKRICESVPGPKKAVKRTALTLGDMFKIVRGIAITRHVFLNANSSFKVRFQNVHLTPVLVIPTDCKINSGAYLIEEQDQGRMSQERARANFFPQVDRVLLDAGESAVKSCDNWITNRLTRGSSSKTWLNARGARKIMACTNTKS